MAQKRLYIDYIKVHQHLSTDTEEVRNEYIEFVDRLTEKGYKIIATAEFADKTHNIEITLNEHGELCETRIE